jgi:hypothetical protein
MCKIKVLMSLKHSVVLAATLSILLAKIFFIPQDTMEAFWGIQNLISDVLSESTALGLRSILVILTHVESTLG